MKKFVLTYNQTYKATPNMPYRWKKYLGKWDADDVEFLDSDKFIVDKVVARNLKKKGDLYYVTIDIHISTPELTDNWLKDADYNLIGWRYTENCCDKINQSAVSGKLL